MTGVVLGVLGASVVLAGAHAVRPGRLQPRVPDTPERRPRAGRPGRRPPERLAALARDAGLPERWVERSGALPAAAVPVVVAVTLLAGPVATAVLVGALAAGPRLAAPSLRRRRRRRRDEQLPVSLERVASGLRAGLSLPGALASTGRHHPRPARTPSSSRSSAAVRRRPGAGPRPSPGGPGPPTPALRSSSPSPRSTWAPTPGGEVARAVDRVAATLRERAERARRGARAGHPGPGLRGRAGRRALAFAAARGPRRARGAARSSSPRRWGGLPGRGSPSRRRARRGWPGSSEAAR